MKSSSSSPDPSRPDLPRVPSDPHIRSRYRGCLLGGAVGDALGTPVEFLGGDEIHGTFGDSGIRDYSEAYGRLGAITDDTQVSLFTAEGMLRARVRMMLKGVCHPPGVVSHAYLRWLATQGDKPHRNIDLGMDGWLITHRELFSTRAPRQDLHLRPQGHEAFRRQKGHRETYAAIERAQQFAIARPGRR